MIRSCRWLVLLFILIATTAVAERISQSPDCLFVDSGRYFKNLSLQIYVPEGTESFTLGIFDQTDNADVKTASEFLLRPPQGDAEQRLEAARAGEWAEYPVDVAGRWGVWQLAIHGPEASKRARNSFMVRTRGEVDLYLRPVPTPRYLPLSAPRFGGEGIHHLYLQTPDINRFRLDFGQRHGQDFEIELIAPKDIRFEEKWGGLGPDEWSGALPREGRSASLRRGTHEYLEITGSGLEGIWEMRVGGIDDFCRLGSEQQLRVFFTDQPLMAMPKRVEVVSYVEGEDEPTPARLRITAPQVARERYRVFTGDWGEGDVFLLSGMTYEITASRGWAFESGDPAIATAESGTVRALVRRLLPQPKGWYGGDSHTHSSYSDGMDTPARVAASARADGLDWYAVTDHAAGVDRVTHIVHSQKEAAAMSEPGRFAVIPGMEYTLVDYHANVLGAVLRADRETPLQEAIDAAVALDTPDRPVTITLNHPYYEGTPKASDLARQLERLPMLELNRPQAIQLWWELLNKGMRVAGTSTTDTHNIETRYPGYRRTYVYLDDQPLTSENVIRALREGRSYASRAAILEFTVNGHRPGDMIAPGPAEIELVAHSVKPIDRIEIIQNGEVVKSFKVGDEKTAQKKITLETIPGWILMQVLEKKPGLPLAVSNPIYIAP